MVVKGERREVRGSGVIGNQGRGLREKGEREKVVFAVRRNRRFRENREVERRVSGNGEGEETASGMRKFGKKVRWG